MTKISHGELRKIQARDYVYRLKSAPDPADLFEAAISEGYLEASADYAVEVTDLRANLSAARERISQLETGLAAELARYLAAREALRVAREALQKGDCHQCSGTGYDSHTASGRKCSRCEGTGRLHHRALAAISRVLEGTG